MDGPIIIRADNQSVITNSSVPESVLKKKSVSVSYHCVREASARGVAVVTYVHTDSNWSDFLTKIQSGPKRQELVRNVLF